MLSNASDITLYYLEDDLSTMLEEVHEDLVEQYFPLLEQQIRDALTDVRYLMKQRAEEAFPGIEKGQTLVYVDNQIEKVIHMGLDREGPFLCSSHLTSLHYLRPGGPWKVVGRDME